MEEVIKECNQQMELRLTALDKELSKVRTGRASINLLDNVRVDYYGTPTPVNQVASLSTPDARTIVVSPFEKKLISDIERAIQIADVGVQPTNDGHVIRLPIPPLNEERRKTIAKGVKKIGEDSKVSIRKVRQEFNTKIKKMEKSNDVGEDASKDLQKNIQTITDKNIKTIETKIVAKEKEVLTI